MPEFNEQFQEALDQIETGLGAFENLLGLSNGMAKVMQNFDVFEDVDDAYDQEDQHIYKDFIRMGLAFVKGHPDARPPEIPVTPPKEKAIIDKSEHSQQDEKAIRLSQANSDAATSNEDTENVDVDFQVVKRKKKARKKKCKEKKVQRLLQYHLKLVEERGLPPSRLMQQHQLQTPKHSSSETCSRRNLLSEFGKLGRNGEETHQVPTKAAVVGSHSGSEEAVHGQPIVNENRISSGFNSPSLYSFSQPLEVSGNAGGSDARTLWMTPQHFQQGWTGVSSGYMQQSSLCSSPVTCLVWNPPVTPVCHAQPTPSLPPSGDQLTACCLAM